MPKNPRPISIPIPTTIPIENAFLDASTPVNSCAKGTRYASGCAVKYAVFGHFLPPWRQRYPCVKVISEMHSAGGRKAQEEEEGTVEGRWEGVRRKLLMFVGHENLKQHLSCCQLEGFRFSAFGLLCLVLMERNAVLPPPLQPGAICDFQLSGGLWAMPVRSLIGLPCIFDSLQNFCSTRWI